MKETPIHSLAPNKHYIPEDFHKVASGAEKQFAELLIKELQKSVSRANPLSTAQQFYQSWNTAEQANIMAHHPEGLGLRDLILDEIYPRSLRTRAAFEHYQNQKEQGYGTN